MRHTTRLFTSVLIILAAGCSKSEDGDSGMLNALAQIAAVNIPLGDGDPVLQPELGAKWELRHNIADSMPPRAFAKLKDGQFRLNAHDFVAHLHPDRVVLNTPSDPEGVTLKLAAWGRGDNLDPVQEVLLQGNRDSTSGGIDLVEADRGNLVEWFDGATRGMEHGWTVVSRPDGTDLLSFLLEIDAAQVDVSVDAMGAWIESDEGTTWNVNNFYQAAEKFPCRLPFSLTDIAATYREGKFEILKVN